MNNKFPKITDDDFHKKINNKFKKYKMEKDRRSAHEICNPKEFKLQEPQKFLEQFMSPKTPYKGILIYHRIGSGKSCTSIRIAEQWKHKKYIVVVMPASIIGNYRSELRSKCAGNEYLNDKERNILKKHHPTDIEYQRIIEKSDKRIDKYYDIYSYNKFVDNINTKKLNLDNTLLIVDEIQNMISDTGIWYRTLYSAIHNANHLRIVLMSATPIFDKPEEIALTMNLLPIPEKFPTGSAFNELYIRKNVSHLVIRNKDQFENNIKGFISYYRGAPDYVFPELNIRYVKCQMSRFQYNIYKIILEKEHKNIRQKTMFKKMVEGDVFTLPSNFYFGPRIVSNIVFPNQKIGEDGFISFTNQIIKDHLDKYSPKFFEIMKRIERCSGKIFIYSAFKEYGGIYSFAKVLTAFGYKNYTDHGEGHKRFAIWSGDETLRYKDEIKTIYNKDDNINGSKIKIILGSPSIKEGVSLFAVRQVHIIEPYWNRSRISQVIGRASRFCSHQKLPYNKRKVKIYIYVAVTGTKEKSIDEYIVHMAIEKDRIIHAFEQSLKETAVDCQLNKNANATKENPIKCSS